MPRPSAAARRVIEAKPGTPDHSYGSPSHCPECGQDTLRAEWLGLDIHLEPTQVPIREDLGGNRYHPGVMQWHPDPLLQWCGLYGSRNWREVRFLHITKCPSRNPATGPTQPKGTT